MNDTTDKDRERIAKLPAWAQGLIAKLTRERDEAIAQMDRIIGEQKPTSVWTEDWVWDNRNGSGPSHVRRYFQHSGDLTIQGDGVYLRVNLDQNNNIRLQYGGGDARSFGDDALCVPEAYQNFTIKPVSRAR